MLDAIETPQPERSGQSARHAARLTVTRDNALVGALLLVVLIFGAFLRLSGTSWDDYVHFHPDERFLVGQVALNMGEGFLSFTDGNELEQRALCNERYPDTLGVGPFFDARCSDWNPHNLNAGHYAYGTMPAFVAKWTGEALNSITGTNDYTGYDSLPLVWRTLSALYDTITLILVFLTALKLHGQWTGLVAAALYAFAVLPLQIAHFATADAMTAMWVAGTVYFAVRAQADGRLLDFIAAGAASGAAVASRANVAPIVLVIIFAATLRALPLFDARLPRGERNRALIEGVGGLVAAGAVSLLVFRIFNPYAFVGPNFFDLSLNQRWLDDLRQAAYETSPLNSAPPQWQWVGRTRYFFAWWNMVMWGMGLAFGLTAWTAWAVSAWRVIRGRRGTMLNAALVLWILVYFGWVGGNFVMSMRYYLPLYSAFAVLAAWGLVALVQHAWRTRQAWRRLAAAGALGGVTAFTVLWGVMFTNIYREPATYVQASYWMWENASGDFSMRIDGRDDVPLINIPLANTLGARNDLLGNATHLFPNQPVTVSFVPHASGEISVIHAPRIGALYPDAGEATLKFTLASPESAQPLAETLLTDTFDYDPVNVGRSYDIPLDRPLWVVEGKRYLFTVELVFGREVATTGSVWTWEGDWDEAVPVQVCELPTGVSFGAGEVRPGMFSPNDCRRLNASNGLITTLQFDIVREDDDAKREQMIRLLDSTDYIIIGTNRRYDSNSRIQSRWPLTQAYYDALFNDKLGFELVGLFQETFELGGLKISDQHLPIYDSPAWLNELEAEEAFHVYDHPVVFVYKKTADYNPQRTREILNAVPLARPPSCGAYTCEYDDTLINVLTWDVERAQDAPTQIMFTPEQRAVQTQGGTWSQRFDRDSAINSDTLLTPVLWWVGVTLIGWLFFPYMFVAFPALADRGFGFARIASMFFIGWIAWFASSYHLPLWSREGLWLITGILTLGAALIVTRRRAAFIGFLRARWRLLLTLEALSAALFVAFVLIRLSNPDLWTTGFGGEKPMDFAYFNGVLRSTVFPPIDTWHAGGYMNYYYFGYVVVGVPVLMFSVVPSIAYNLIVPTIASAVGVGAFSAAFSIVSALQRTDSGGARRTLGNPYIAGIAALLLAAVLGNLDTPRVFVKGIAQLGGWQDIDLQTFLLNEYARDHNGAAPDGDTYLELSKEAVDPSLGTRLRYELDFNARALGALSVGIGAWGAGAALPIGADRWFWAPTRTITESVGGYAINEMPFFTFLYGDLHAHMISMPLMLLAVAFVFNELALAGREQRGRGARLLALSMGAVLVGMFIAVNSWEAPTFILFGVLGLGYAWWLQWRELTRRSLWAMFVTIGGFLVIGQAAAMPYNTWFASAYSSFRVWDGSLTPLWAYFNIHGLFLFLLVVLLVWETGRWLQATRVTALRGRRRGLLIGALTLVSVVVLSVLLGLFVIPVAVIVLPLLMWIVVLFFRPNQSIPMQFVLVLAGLALSITLGVEVIVLDGDIGRQNTVFKFYVQVWMLFSVMGGAAFAWVMAHVDQWPRVPRVLWYGVGGVLLFAATLYPIMAIPAKAVYRLADNMPLTFDGAKFMDYATSYYEGDSIVDMQADANAIRWLQDNVQGTPAIIEAVSGGEYRWGGRIAIQSGFPAVIGWGFHQRQQRGLHDLSELVWQRAANVNFFYRSNDMNAAWRILHFYNVEYVVVAGLERALYGLSGGLEKFPRMVELGWLELAYSAPNVEIYRVKRDANPAASTAAVVTESRQ